MKAKLQKLAEKVKEVKKQEEVGKENFIKVCEYLCKLLEQDKFFIMTIENWDDNYPLFDIYYHSDKKILKKHKWQDYGTGEELGTYYITRKRICNLVEHLNYRINFYLDKLDKQKEAYQKLQKITKIITN